jgi:hypothetical protein
MASARPWPRTRSWQHYEHSRSAAAQSDSVPHESHAAAEQAFVLIDARATRDAVELLDGTRRRADASSPRILRAWLAAVHGEALAAHGDQTASLHAFDRAAELLPNQGPHPRPQPSRPILRPRRGRAPHRPGDSTRGRWQSGQSERTCQAGPHARCRAWINTTARRLQTLAASLPVA